MDAFAWFWLAVIICIITIGVNSTLCTYWRYKYTSDKKKMKLLRTSPEKGRLFPDSQKMNN